MMSCWTFVSVLVALVASAASMDYELDQSKLDQRYNLIQSLVSAGIPGKGGYGASHKPVIGAAYARPQVGYSHGGGSYKPNNYGGYNANNLYGAGRSYGNYGNYGNYGYGNRNPGGYASQISYKPGGGAYHPLFNNDNLYKPVQRPTYNDNSYSGYDNYNNKDPIYLSSKSPNLYSQSGYQQKTAPQLNAYGAHPSTYSGKDVAGTPYTGQKGNMYSNLPGYTNPYFNKY